MRLMLRSLFSWCWVKVSGADGQSRVYGGLSISIDQPARPAAVTASAAARVGAGHIDVIDVYFTDGQQSSRGRSERRKLGPFTSCSGPGPLASVSTDVVGARTALPQLGQERITHLQRWSW